MGTNSSRSTSIALLPLARDSVLLPGVTLRIPLSDRPDIPLLLTSLFSKSSSKTGNAATLVGCVPLNSPFLSTDGKQLLDNVDRASTRSAASRTVEPAKASKHDLFSYGTVAKVVGVQGRPNSEPYLLVEGLRRFSIRKITNETPFFEADVTLHDEIGRLPCARPCSIIPIILLVQV